jgi:5-methylcytosine-specific restriction endonuclease McrA
LGTQSSFRTLNQIRTYLPDDYVKALKTVEYVFKINPIPRLQNVGDSSVPFLYTYSTLDAEDGNKDVHRSGDRIQWLQGVAQRLVILGPALRPLIEQHWMADVARWSNISTETENLQQHLFGRERRRFPSSLREGLSDLQDGKCFYCGRGFSKQQDIDHFIPWARWPNDAIENLVLADNCNSQKSDSLAAITHLNRWIERNSVHAAKLSDLADQTEVVSAPERSLALAKSTYKFLDGNSPLWLAKKEFELRGWLEISALS